MLKHDPAQKMASLTLFLAKSLFYQPGNYDVCVAIRIRFDYFLAIDCEETRSARIL